MLHHACADGGAGRRQVRAGLIPHSPFNPNLPFLRQLAVLLSSFSKLLACPLCCYVGEALQICSPDYEGL